MTTPYDHLTVEQLEAQKLMLDAQIAPLVEQKRAIAQVISAKLSAERMAAKLALFSDEERLALLQSIQAEATGSAEAFGAVKAV